MRFAEAEVHDHRPVRCDDDDVRRFQIDPGDAALVQVVEGIAQLDAPRHDGGRLDRRRDLGQCRAVEALHDQSESTVGFLEGAQAADQPRVVERRADVDLAPEAGAQVRIGSGGTQFDQLDGDLLPVGLVLGGVDGAHGADADAPDDPVAPVGHRPTLEDRRRDRRRGDGRGCRPRRRRRHHARVTGRPVRRPTLDPRRDGRWRRWRRRRPWRVRRGGRHGDDRCRDRVDRIPTGGERHVVSRTGTGE